MPKPESIESFIGRLKDGLARPNRYIVSFALPPGVSGSNADSAAGMAQSGAIHSSLTGMNENNMVEVLCHTCSMPGRGINTTDHVHYGAPYKAPIGQDYSTANFTFNTDTKYNSRKFFELWQQTIVNIETNTLNFYKEYIADVTIKAYDRENKAELHHCCSCGRRSGNKDLDAVALFDAAGVNNAFELDVFVVLALKIVVDKNLVIRRFFFFYNIYCLNCSVDLLSVLVPVIDSLSDNKKDNAYSNIDNRNDTHKYRNDCQYCGFCTY